MANAGAGFVVGGGQGVRGTLTLRAAAAKAALTPKGEAREELLGLWSSHFGEPQTPKARKQANDAIGKALLKAGYPPGLPGGAASRGAAGKFVYMNPRDARSPSPERRVISAAPSPPPVRRVSGAAASCGV